MIRKLTVASVLVVACSAQHWGRKQQHLLRIKYQRGIKPNSFGAKVGVKSFYNLPSGWIHVRTTGPSWDQTFIIKKL